MFLASVVIGGCVLPLPSRHAPPYVVGQNVNLTLGTTTREDAVRSLGEPAATYCEGRELVYVAFQQTVELFIAAVVPSPALPIGAVNVQQVGKEHVLRIQFDEAGVVGQYDLQAAKGGWFSRDSCTTSGACVLHGSLFRYAPAEVEAQAKQFQAVPGLCSVYVYWEQRERALWIDGRKAAPVMPADAFLWFALAPGAHSFWAPRSPRGTAAYEEQTLTLQMTCEPGSVVFLGQAHLRDDDRVQRSLPGPIDAAQAQRAIAERRLIMASDPWGDASCGKVPSR